MSSGSALQHIRTTVIAAILVLVAGYSLFSARHIIEGPQIKIKNPTNGKAFTESLISIEGKAKNVAFITLNDRQIFVDEQGKLQEKLLLSPGYNIIKLYARDKFGREVTKQLELVLTEAAPIVPLTPSVSTSTEVSTTSTSSPARE